MGKPAACLRAANGACSGVLNSGEGPGSGSREALLQTALALEALHPHGSVSRGPDGSISKSLHSLHGTLCYSFHSPSSSAALSSNPKMLHRLFCVSAHTGDSLCL